MGIQNLHIMLCNSFAFAKVLPKLSCFLVFLCSSFFLQAQSDCANVTDGGSITGTETGCAKPSFDPSIITSVTTPSGGSGQLEFLWMKTTGDPNAPFNEWTIIPGAKGLSYDPLPIFQTTYYARCSRRFPCSDYNGETNFITKEIKCCSFDVVINPSSITACIGTSVSLATNNTTNASFIWTSNGGSIDNPTSATPVFSATTGGNYIVTVLITNSEGCEGSATIPITISSLVASTSVTNTNCGGDDGSITATVSGGTAPYSYDWGDRFGNTATIDKLGAGNYLAIITDSNGCSTTVSGEVIGTADINTNITTTDVSCAGQDGSINLSITGGQAPYTINWDNNLGSTTNPTNLSVGTYSVTITDQSGCNHTDVVTVSGATNINVSAQTTNASCSNGNDGVIALSVSQGTAPYVYTWTGNVSTGATAQNLAAGTYEVTVLDAGGCSAIINRTILAPSALTANIASDEACTVSSGTSTITVSGGTPGYTYAWNDANNQTTQQAVNLAAGAYTATITDRNGCTTTASTTVSAGGLLVTAETTKTGCMGAPSGTAILSVANGVTPFSYQWPNGLPNRDRFEGLAEGTYNVTVTDAASCTGTVEVKIYKDSNFSISVNVQGATCNENNGRAAVIVEGPQDAYTYGWNDSNNTKTNSATGLAPAIYTVTVTDSGGCSLSAVASITGSPTNISANITATASQICAGEVMGLSTTVQGTVNSYTWSASSGSFDDSTIPNPTYTPTESGSHTITLSVQDNNGCQATATTTVQVFQPIGGTISTTDNTVFCVDDGRPDIVNVNLANGNGTNSNWLITDSDGTILVVTNTPVFDFEGVAEGTCFIQHISYNNPLTESILPGGNINQLTGCFSLSNSIQVERLAGENCTALCQVAGGTLSTADPTTVCVGDGTLDQINVSLLGNLGAQSTWVITDNQDNILTLPVGPPFDFENVPSGTCKIWHISSLYPLSLSIGSNLNSISDCHALSTNAIVVNRTSPSAVSIIAPTTTTCRNTPIQLTTNLTSTTNSYSWTSIGEVFDDANSASPIFTPSFPGSYTVSVTVSNGVCTSTGTLTIEVPDDLQIAAQVTPNECAGKNTGSISLTINGGSAPFTYAWSDGINTSSTLSNLEAGDYTVTVTDAIGCSATSTVTVTTTTTLSLILIGTDLLCNGDRTGEIHAEVAGGQAPYTYVWNGKEETNHLTGLLGGIYQIVVTDANGCSIREDITILEPPVLEFVPQVTTAACNIGGTASVIATGGSGTLNYQWSIPSSPNAPTISNLTAGIYSVTISDQNNCFVVTSMEVLLEGITQCNTEITSPITSANGVEGALNTNVTGGSVYTYLWNTGATTATLNGLSAGNYAVTITDEFGCTCSSTATLTNPSKIGDYAFEDKNNNGLQDPTEEGLRGVLIQLGGTTAEGEVFLSEIRTDDNGFYEFLVPAGTYKITVIDHLNLKLSPQNAGDESLDSDIDPISLMSEMVTVAPGEYYLDLDIGLVPTGFCDNLLTGGTAGADEEICLPNGDPELMFNISYPTGGSGEIQYLWLTSNKPTYSPEDPDWVEIPNSDHEYFDPASIFQSTYFVRCARRKGCNNYPGETNVVAKEIVNCGDTPNAEDLLVSIIDNQIELKWTGNIALENSTFVIERSEDGISYKTISTTKGYMSDSYTQYDYMDKTPMIGENYYRIKTVHPEMGYHISNIAMAMLTPKKDLRVTMYPNPIYNEVMVHFLEDLGETTILEVANGFGQVIKHIEIESDTKKYLLDMSNVPGGIYYIKFQNKLLKRYSQKIVKRD